MGLKQENYELKKVGITIPEAYAVLRNLIIESDNRVRAIFAIQQSREMTSTHDPLKKVEVHFVWDRKTDPAKMAYKEAKKQMITRAVKNENGEWVEQEFPGELNGWEDDIVE